uniref:Rab-GAP TBC domain-containing protein n=1 Tax=Rodentolepis nana TaxID=102285 RepID=A0A0R3T8V9_RODNA
LKDFSTEVRANMDIKMFIKEATLLMDMEASSIEEIIHDMLDAVFKDSGDQTNHSSSTPTNIGAGTQRLFLTPSHSRRGSTIDINQCGVNNSSNNNNHGNSNIDTKSHTLTRASRTSLFASRMSTLGREELIEQAKKALLLEIKHNDSFYRRLSKTIKSVSFQENEGITTDQSWICALCSLKHIQKRYLALARLAYPVNLGRSNEGTQIILLVISPQKEMMCGEFARDITINLARSDEGVCASSKKTKSDIELGRTFATILSDLEFRRQLIFAQDEAEVKALLCARAHELEEEHAQLRIDDIIEDCFEPTTESDLNIPFDVSLMHNDPKCYF